MAVDLLSACPGLSKKRVLPSWWMGPCPVAARRSSALAKERQAAPRAEEVRPKVGLLQWQAMAWQMNQNGLCMGLARWT